jgi:hypothetical protein
MAARAKLTAKREGGRCDRRGALARDKGSRWTGVKRDGVWEYNKRS